jgi:glutamyl-tRNA reductase
MINVLGISHKTAPLDVRGVFAISKHEIVPLSEKIMNETEIAELVILSTCNRTEIYYCNPKAYHTKETNRVLLGILHHLKKAKAHYTEHFYAYNRDEAIKHLFRVTSGMDSMVIGEDQIVKQVKDAYIFCTEKSLTDAILMRLFQKSFEVAKKVRTHTNIQQGATSASYVAVDLANQIAGDLSTKKILLVGLGETGRLVHNNLKKKDARNITLCNRTFEKAEALSLETGDDILPFENLKKHLNTFDIIFTATTSEEIIIGKQDLKPAKGRKQTYIDLSVPRNVDKSIDENENIALFGMDDLMAIINENTNMRKDSLSAAEIILNETTKEYLSWLDVRSLKPVIQAISKKVKQINEQELKASMAFHTPEELKLIEEYSQRLAQKYIRSFIKNLKRLSKDGSSVHMLKTINEMFASDGEGQVIAKVLDEVMNK